MTYRLGPYSLLLTHQTWYLGDLSFIAVSWLIGLMLIGFWVCWLLLIGYCLLFIGSLVYIAVANRGKLLQPVATSQPVEHR